MLVVLVSVGAAVLVACIFLANVAVLGLVNRPFHVVDAPVECLGANLFLFWFVFFGWQFLPFLILLLKAFVCLVLLILAVCRTLLLRSISALWWLSLLLSPLTLFLTLLELVDELC